MRTDRDATEQLGTCAHFGAPTYHWANNVVATRSKSHLLKNSAIRSDAYVGENHHSVGVRQYQPPFNQAAELNIRTTYSTPETVAQHS